MRHGGRLPAPQRNKWPFARRWDGLFEWFRAIGEIVLATGLGMALIFFAFYTHDETLGRIWWLLGCIVWIGGVARAVLGAYRRGLEDGLW